MAKLPTMSPLLDVQEERKDTDWRHGAAPSVPLDVAATDFDISCCFSEAKVGELR
jgi:hypothetical protein